MTHSGVIQRKVFISYRHEDAQGWADLLNERLVGRFGQVNVFYDLDTIPVGENFEEFIETQISECDVLIALIGKSWIRGKSESENGDDDGPDYVEIEIGIALRLGKRVIPVLVNDASMPTEKHLPDKIKKLAKLNATKLRPGREGHADTDRLIAAIEKKPRVETSGPPAKTPCKLSRVTIVLPEKPLSITLEPEGYKSALNTFLWAHFFDCLVLQRKLGRDCWTLKYQYPNTNDVITNELPGGHEVDMPSPKEVCFDKYMPLWSNSHDRPDSILKLGAIIGKKEEFQVLIDEVSGEFLGKFEEREVYEQYRQNKLDALRNPIERKFLLYLIKCRLEGST
jgi:hypothetical protein